MGSAGGIGSAEVVVREGRKLEGRGKEKKGSDRIRLEQE